MPLDLWFDALTLALILVTLARLVTHGNPFGPRHSLGHILTAGLVLLGFHALSCLLAGSGITWVLEDYRPFTDALVPVICVGFVLGWTQHRLIVQGQQTTAALRESQRLAAGVMERSEMGILIVEADGRAAFINPAGAAVFGVSRAKFTDRPLPPDGWHIYNHDGLELDPEDFTYAQVMAIAPEISGTQYTVILPSGARRVITVSVAPLGADNGEIERTVLTFLDVTDQAAAHARANRLNAVLQATREIEQLIVRERDPDRLLQLACERLVATRGYDYAAITRLDPPGKSYWAAKRRVARHLPALAGMPRLVPPVTAPLAEDNDAEQYLCTLQAPLALPGHQAATVRLRYEEHLYGVLTVGIAPDIVLDADEHELLHGAAADLSFALHSLAVAAARRRAEAELRDQMTAARTFLDRLRALIDVDNALTAIETTDRLFRCAVELGARRLGFARIGLWLCDDDDPYCLHGTYGMGEDGVLRDERDATVTISPEVASWDPQKPHEVFLETDVPLYDHTRSVIGRGERASVLLWVAETRTGLLCIDNLLDGAPLTAADCELLGLYAVLLGNLYRRNRAEMALREQERFYRTLFETTGAATMVVDETMVATHLNAQTEALIGISAAEAAGRICLTDFVAPDDRELVRQHHRQRRIDPAGTPHNYEIQIVDGQGRVRDVALFADLIPGTRQSVVSLVDITDLKEALATARWRAAQQRALSTIIMRATASGSLDELLNVTLSHVVAALEVDMVGCTLLGHTATLGLPKDAWCAAARHETGIVAPDCSFTVADWQAPDLDRPAAIIEHVQALGVRASIIVPITTPAREEPLGALVVAHAAPREWTSEEVALLETVARQLGSTAERLQLLAGAQRHAQQLQRIIDTVPEGVIVLDAQDRVWLTNAHGRNDLTALAGAAPGDRLRRLGDTPLATFFTAPPQGRWHELAWHDRAYELLAKPLASAAGLTGWVIVIRDVTEHREIARQLEQQERVAAVGRLAAGIAHDFNNIIAVIVLYVQMALADPNVPQKLRDRLAVANEQAHRATKLIEQILDFSRRSTLEPHPLHLLPYLKEVVQLLERTLPESIHVELDHNNENDVVNADPTRIQQALMNLATNARDAMPDGGTLHIALDRLTSTGPGEGPLATLPPGEWVQIAVRDTGSGIPADILPYVFEPFFTTKDNGKGTGLGLSQVQGILKQHGGDVTITSTVGAGTTVTLFLPALAGPAVAELEPAATDVLPQGRQETILLVEDSPQMQDALTAALEALGYSVIATRNGHQALACLERHGDDIALILSDAVMPEMGVMSLMVELDARHLHQPIIVISGYLPPEKHSRLRQYPNFVAWLAKPIDLDALATTLAGALHVRNLPHPHTP